MTIPISNLRVEGGGQRGLDPFRDLLESLILLHCQIFLHVII